MLEDKQAVNANSQGRMHPPSFFVPYYSSGPPLSRTLSTTSDASDTSNDADLDRLAAKLDPTISLRALLQVIEAHRSLQDARIIQVDSYQNAKIPFHRFIILQLEREGRKQIWLRIDRRRDKTKTIGNFAWKAGTSPANDRVSC